MQLAILTSPVVAGVSITHVVYVWGSSGGADAIMRVVDVNAHGTHVHVHYS